MYKSKAFSLKLGKMKERKETDLRWMKIKTIGSRIDCVYGLRDGTSIHGHTVLSGSEMIYQRNISGAQLMLSGANLILSN